MFLMGQDPYWLITPGEIIKISKYLATLNFF